MKKLFGNGRPLAAAVLAVGVAAIAVPAFGDSKGGAGQAAPGPPRPGALPLPRPPAMTGAMRKRADKVASCMRSKEIPGAQKRGAGLFIGPSAASSKAFRKAAKECGAPPPPPRGKLLPPPMGVPGAGAKFEAGVARCLHASKSQAGAARHR